MRMLTNNELDVLEFIELCNKEGRQVDDHVIARAMGMADLSIHRIVEGLCARDYVAVIPVYDSHGWLVRNEYRVLKK